MLMETFDSDIKIDWLCKEPLFGCCYCTIGGQHTYRITFKEMSKMYGEDEYPAGWDIAFALYKEGRFVFDKTGTKNQYQIISAVLKAYKEFFGNDEPEMIYMDAKEPNRRDLYVRILKKSMPNRTIEIDDSCILAKLKTGNGQNEIR